MQFKQLRGYLNYTYAQFWIWGQDLQHKKRETFLAYGFKRYPPPAAAGGKSMYVVPIGSSGFLCLWAFGLMIGTLGQAAFFIRRGSLSPKVVEKVFNRIPSRYLAFEELEMRRIEKRTATPAPWRAHQVALATFILRYEFWIEGTQGTAYRKECLKRWKSRHFHPARITSTLIELESLGFSWGLDNRVGPRLREMALIPSAFQSINANELHP